MNAAVYRRAVEIIDERGWGQGIERSPRVCAMDAVALAAGLPRSILDFTAADAARDDALTTELGRHVGRLVTVWNDDPNRTEAEVRAALLALADELERA